MADALLGAGLGHCTSFSEVDGNLGLTKQGICGAEGMTVKT